MTALGVGVFVGADRKALPGPIYVTATVTAVGDSFVLGGVGGVDSFMEEVTQDWGATLTNSGLGGTLLQNGNDAGGAPRPNNLMDSFDARTIATGTTAIVCAYGFNDARYVGDDGAANGYGYTLGPTQFHADLSSACRRWLPHYGRDNIWLVTPHYISDAGLMTGSAGFTGQSRTGYEAYVTACREVAQDFGLRLVDSYAAGAPSTTVDNIHPTDAGRAQIAACFDSATRATLPVSSGSLSSGENQITIAAGLEAYVIDGATETALSVGANTVAAGAHTVVWRASGGRWEVSELTVTAPTSALYLDASPAENVGFSVSSSGTESLSLTGTTSRNSIAWAADWPPGTQIDCDVTADGLRVIARLNQNTLLNGASETVFDQVVSGTAPVSFTTTAGGNVNDYFGLVTVATGDLEITNFVVTLP